ncbi:adhesion G protein-coupled receptor E3-like [Bolinopsis microptera]|uniref:adhesion G protein-coupled receptor E3-like n=1 Tax=Bolinopsis microptera TaxID=2820187 RepID=UPI00307922AE
MTCKKCKAYKLCNYNKKSIISEICAPGWYSRNGGKEPSCLRCDPSEYQPYPQQTRCLACAGSVNREKTACLPVSANVRCGPISITLPWLNKGSPIEFEETWAGNRSSVNCPGGSYKKLYKECTVEGYWDDNTDTDECDSPLSSCLQSVLEVESDLNADKVHDLNKELNCVADAGAEIILSPRDTHEIVDLLSKLTKHPTSEVNELSLVMIRSMENLRRGESKFLKESEKSEIIKILETVSKSNTEDNIITTDSIVLQSVTPTMSKEKPAINLTAPETVPADDLPIMLDFGNQRGQKINVAVMDESYKKMLPKPTTPNSTLGSPIVSIIFLDSEIIDGYNFSLVFQQKKDSTISGDNIKRTCVYLDVVTDEWLTEGCTTILNEDKTCMCTCTHTTSFAVLLSPTEVTDPAQDIFSYFMSAVNLIFLFLTLGLILPFKKLRQKQATLIQLNLILALILANLSFTSLSASTKITVDQSGNPLLSLNKGCVAGVIITQYFFLSALSWMGCCAWNFFGKIVNAIKTFGNKDKFLFHKCVAVSWLLPLIFPVAAFLTSLTLNKDDYSTPYVGATRKNDTSCWVEDPWRYVGFMVPAYTILLFNCVCFGMIARVIIRAANSGSGISSIEKTAKALMIVAVSIGCPWIVIALAVGPGAVFMQYLFILLTGLQGPLLFTALVVFQEDVKDNTLALLRIKQSKKEEGKKNVSITQASVVNSNAYANSSQGAEAAVAEKKDGRKEEDIIYEDVEECEIARIEKGSDEIESEEKENQDDGKNSPNLV